MVKTHKQKREMAEYEWVRGGGIETIAERYNIPLGTIRSWHWKYRWAEKRKDFIDKVAQTLFGKLTEHIEKSAERYLACSLLFSQMGFEVLQKSYNDGEHFTDHKKILAWANILMKGSTIHRNVVPDPDEQLSQSLLDELRKLNAVSTKENKRIESGTVQSEGDK